LKRPSSLAPAWARLAIGAATVSVVPRILPKRPDVPWQQVALVGGLALAIAATSELSRQRFRARAPLGVAAVTLGAHLATRTLFAPLAFAAPLLAAGATRSLAESPGLEPRARAVRALAGGAVVAGIALAAGAAIIAAITTGMSAPSALPRGSAPTAYVADTLGFGLLGASATAALDLAAWIGRRPPRLTPIRSPAAQPPPPPSA
jgi:hypothetical protein